MRLLGMRGESPGAATSAAALQYKPAVDFVVADCGFSNIKEILMRGSGLHGWMIDTVSFFARLRCGYSYAEMRPVDCLAENQMPICFIRAWQITSCRPSTAGR